LNPHPRGLTWGHFGGLGGVLGIVV
jgi:hypothetical protein